MYIFVRTIHQLFILNKNETPANLRFISIFYAGRYASSLVCYSSAALAEPTQCFTQTKSHDDFDRSIMQIFSFFGVSGRFEPMSFLNY